MWLNLGAGPAIEEEKNRWTRWSMRRGEEGTCSGREGGQPVRALPAMQVFGGRVPRASNGKGGGTGWAEKVLMGRQDTLRNPRQGASRKYKKAAK